MWQVLTSSESIAAAQASLVSEYDVEPEQLQQDLDKLITQLVEQGLIEIVHG
jgi:hypothetical protein